MSSPASEPPVPVRLAIGAHVYTVDTSDEARNSLYDDNARGDSFPDRAKIRVRHDLAPSVQREVLIHEAMHCMWAQTGLRTNNDVDEEAVIATLAPLVYDLLHRNPELVAYLTAS